MGNFLKGRIGDSSGNIRFNFRQAEEINERDVIKIENVQNRVDK